MIQRDCTLYPTGLYRYSKYENDEQHGFFVTKEQLKGHLEKTTMFILIVFKTRIEIDSEACVRLETRLEDEMRMGVPTRLPKKKNQASFPAWLFSLSPLTFKGFSKKEREK